MCTTGHSHLKFWTIASHFGAIKPQAVQFATGSPTILNSDIVAHAWDSLGRCISISRSGDVLIITPELNCREWHSVASSFERSNSVKCITIVNGGFIIAGNGGNIIVFRMVLVSQIKKKREYYNEYYCNLF